MPAKRPRFFEKTYEGRLFAGLLLRTARMCSILLLAAAPPFIKALSSITDGCNGG
jgi:hypothetical protein